MKIFKQIAIIVGFCLIGEIISWAITKIIPGFFFPGSLIGMLLLFLALYFKLFKIDTAISRGVAMGSASHGVGLTKLKEYSEEDLSIGSLSMGLSAVVGAFIIPLISIYLF